MKLLKGIFSKYKGIELIKCCENCTYYNPPCIDIKCGDCGSIPERSYSNFKKKK